MKLKINRYDDIEFVSELLFVILEGQIQETKKETIDDLYDKYCKEDKEEYLQNDYQSLKSKFESITDRIRSFNLDFQIYRIDSVSHLYGLWGFAWELEKIDDKNNYSALINDFYTKFKKKDNNEFVVLYRVSMQAATKTKNYRTKRINALLGYCNTGITI